MEKRKLTVFLTFSGVAEEAMQFYADSLPSTTIQSIVRYGKEAGEEAENKVLHGSLSFQGEEIMFMDIVGEVPAFSWATSIYVDCQSEEEFDAIFTPLSQQGSVMMGPEPVAQFRKVAWVTDKFGVTWQPVWE